MFFPMMGSVRPSAAAQPSVTITFPAATVYPLDDFHVRHGLIGGTMARAWVSFVRGGTRYAFDFMHGATTDTRSGANCTTWESQLSGATRAQIVLANGNRTGAQVATAFNDALVSAGITNAIVVGASVTIPTSSGALLGADHDATETLRGLWGCQRSSFGAADTDDLLAAMGPTVSVQLAAPSTAGRILAVVALDTTGAGAITMGIANGPAYAAADITESGGVEGTAVIGTNGSLRVFVLPEPQAYTSAQSKWINFTAPNDGTTNIGYRLHGRVIVGRGTLPLNQAILSHNNGTNVVPIFTAGAYTYVHANRVGGSPFSVYSHVGFVYEMPVSGRYPGRGHVDAWGGYHGSAAGGTPTTGPAAVIRGISECFRHDVPAWADTITQARFAYAANGAGEDSRLAIYDWSSSVVAQAPVVVAPSRLADCGLMGVSASISNAYHTFTLPTPVAVTGLSRVGIHVHHGRIDGSTATAISSLYDPGPSGGGADGYLTGYVDTVSEWSDLIALLGGYDANAQYVTTSSGDMPVGLPSTPAPATFDPNATDLLPTNLWRHAIRWRREGMTAA